VERDRWDRLRQQVRAALTSRGVTVQALAARLGKATSTLKSALETKSPPSQVLQQQLTEWLAAPEVAAEPAATFRGNGAGHADNGAAEQGAP
jgi:lambda repressor-like predicted transcriptional regulator